MNKLVFLASTLALSTLAACADMKDQAVSQAPLSKAEVLALVSNSVYSTDNGISGVISPKGTLSSVSSDGSKSLGTWSVKDDGQYCLTWDNKMWIGGCGQFYHTPGTDSYQRTFSNFTATYSFTKL